MLRRLCVTLCLLCSVGVARALTLNVGPAGSGATYTKIQDAINAANAGDIVLVAAGIYYEHIDFGHKAINVVSSSGAVGTVIDGGLSGTVMVLGTADGVAPAILDGFTIQNGVPNWPAGGTANYGGGVVIIGNATVQNNLVQANRSCGIDIEGGNVSVRHNQVLSNQGIDNSPVYCGTSSFGIFTGAFGGGQSSGPNTVTVESNRVEGNFSGGIGGNASAAHVFVINNTVLGSTSGAGINFDNVHPLLVVSGNVIANNAGTGIYAVWAGISDTYVISNNTAYNNGTAGGATLVREMNVTAESLVVANNIVYDTARSGVAWMLCQDASVISGSFDHNDIYIPNAGSQDILCGMPVGQYGNTTVEPQFVAPVIKNFHLNAGSPAIDAGNNSAPYLNTTDLDGNPREADATSVGYPIVDLGAYEYSGTQDANPTTVTLMATPPNMAAGTSVILVAQTASANGIPTGQINFAVDGTVVATASINSTGSATATATFTPGFHHVVALYSGQGVFTPGTSLVRNIFAAKYVTTIQISSSVDPSILGQPVTFHIHASSADTSYIPNPLTLSDQSYGSMLATLNPDSSGNTSYTTSSLTLGTHIIAAEYAGDAIHAFGSSDVNQCVVTAIPTATTVGGSPNPGIVGQSILLIAHVSAGCGAGVIPTGSVVFTYGSTTLGTAALDGSGNASVSTSALPAGYDTITASYQPSNSFAASTGSFTEQVLSGYPTTTTLTSSLNPASPVQSVMFTAKVVAQNAANGTPTGSLVFRDGANVVSTVVLPAGVTTATWSSTLTAGVHDVTVTFVPTGSFATSVAEVLETVGWATVTTTSVTPEPSTYGQTKVFSAHVTGIAGSVGTPSGTVQLVFCHGATYRLTLDANGNGSVTVPVLGEISDPVGSCPYMAQYQGDGTFLPSASASTPYIVNPSTSKTTLSVGPNPGFVGQAVTLTATVVGTPSPSLGPGGEILPPGATVATGTVQFYDGGTAIGNAVVLSAAQTVTLTTSSLGLGSHTITAQYSGDANLQASTSAGVVELIQQVGTSTGLIVQPNPGVQNEPVTMGVTVASLAGTGPPYGLVTIMDGGTVLTTLPLSPGTGTSSSVSFTTSSLTVGTHPLQATFKDICTATICGTYPFLDSQSAVVAEVIQPQDFSVDATPPSISIQTKHHASMTLTVTPIGQFNGPVTLACVGVVPKWSSCSFSNARVVLQGTAPVTTTLTIETDEIKGYASNTDRRGLTWLAMLLPLAMVGFRKRRRVVLMLVVVLGSVAVISMSACSGRQPENVEPGTYTMTVQGTGIAAGTQTLTTHTLAITLHVTP